MSVIQIITNLFGLITGIGVFLMSIKLIGNHLEYVGGNNLKLLFAKTSKSNTLGVGIGVISTALIQSSGATSVMAIGFVSAGIMSVMQACSIILGANIGTTITGQIAAIGFLGGSGTVISVSTILAALACIGAFMVFFGKKEMTKQFGGLLAGFGLLFVGLSLMSSSMKPFAEIDSIKSAIASIDFPGYSVVLTLIGILLTAIMQSSSVTSSLSITMYMSNLITLDQGIYLILGSNIGAVIVALIASMGGSSKAKQVSFFHLITNVIRVVLSIALIEIVLAVLGHKYTLGTLFEIIFPDDVKALRLSMFHTFYNIITVAILIPFIPAFVKLSQKVIKEKEVNDNGLKLYYLDAHLMKNPSVAVQQVKNEVMNMAQITNENFNRSVDIICSLDFEDVDTFKNTEKEINFLTKSITNFVIELSKQELPEKDHLYLATVYHSITDIERIGDYAENIVEYADKLKSINGAFSESAVDEIRNLQVLVNEMYEKTMLTYSAMDIKLFEESYKVEDRIDIMCEEMADNHIQRLSDGTCQADIGAQFLSFTSDTERIADHWLNVGKAAKHIQKK